MNFKDALSEYTGSPMSETEYLMAEYFYTVGKLHAVMQRAKDLGLEVASAKDKS